MHRSSTGESADLNIARYGLEWPEARFGFAREGRKSNDFDEAGLDHGSIETCVGGATKTC
jgi:hypothetical protein